MDRWRKFQRLSWSERWLLVQALLLLLLIAPSLHLFGFRRLHVTLINLSPMGYIPVRSKAQALSQAYATARMVQVAAWHGPYRANCLQKSLVLWWLLRRQEIQSDLRIGVRKEASWFEAHAWVEHLGLALNDTDDFHQRFEAFDRVIVPVGVKS